MREPDRDRNLLEPLGVRERDERRDPRDPFEPREPLDPCLERRDPREPFDADRLRPLRGVPFLEELRFRRAERGLEDERPGAAGVEGVRLVWLGLT